MARFCEGGGEGSRREATGWGWSTERAVSPVCVRPDATRRRPRPVSRPWRSVDTPIRPYHPTLVQLQHIRPTDQAVAAGRRVEYFVSGGGGVELHAELKPEVDPSLNAGVVSAFRATTLGFVSVDVTKNALHVTFISDHNEELYHTSITHADTSTVWAGA